VKWVVSKKICASPPPCRCGQKGTGCGWCDFPSSGWQEKKIFERLFAEHIIIALILPITMMKLAALFLVLAACVSASDKPVAVMLTLENKSGRGCEIFYKSDGAGYTHLHHLDDNQVYSTNTFSGAKVCFIFLHVCMFADNLLRSSWLSSMERLATQSWPTTTSTSITLLRAKATQWAAMPKLTNVRPAGVTTFKFF